MQHAYIIDKADDQPYLYGCNTKTAGEFMNDFRDHLKIVNGDGINGMENGMENGMVALVMREKEGAQRMNDDSVLDTNSVYRLEVVSVRDVLIQTFQEWRKNGSLEQSMHRFGEAFDKNPSDASTLSIKSFKAQMEELVEKLLDFHPWSGVKTAPNIFELFVLLTLTYHAWKREKLGM